MLRAACLPAQCKCALGDDASLPHDVPPVHKLRPLTAKLLRIIGNGCHQEASCGPGRYGEVRDQDALVEFLGSKCLCGVHDHNLARVALLGGGTPWSHKRAAGKSAAHFV